MIEGLRVGSGEGSRVGSAVSSRHTAHRSPPLHMLILLHGNCTGVLALLFHITSLSCLFKQPYGRLLLFWQQLFHSMPKRPAADSHSAAELINVPPLQALVVT